jgi:hypothetical protein
MATLKGHIMARLWHPFEFAYDPLDVLRMLISLEDARKLFSFRMHVMDVLLAKFTIFLILVMHVRLLSLVVVVDEIILQRTSGGPLPP